MSELELHGAARVRISLYGEDVTLTVNKWRELLVDMKDGTLQRSTIISALKNARSTKLPSGEVILNVAPSEPTAHGIIVEKGVAKCKCGWESADHNDNAIALDVGAVHLLGILPKDSRDDS